MSVSGCKAVLQTNASFNLKIYINNVPNVDFLAKNTEQKA